MTWLPVRRNKRNRRQRNDDEDAEHPDPSHTTAKTKRNTAPIRCNARTIDSHTPSPTSNASRASPVLQHCARIERTATPTKNTASLTAITTSNTLGWGWNALVGAVWCARVERTGRMHRSEQYGAPGRNALVRSVWHANVERTSWSSVVRQGGTHWSGQINVVRQRGTHWSDQRGTPPWNALVGAVW